MTAVSIVEASTKRGRRKGTAKTGGRTKGTPNKINGDLKGMILGALAAEGGVSYLQKQAQDNPNAFLSLVGRVLPLTVSGDKDNPVQHTITVSWAASST